MGLPSGEYGNGGSIARQVGGKKEDVNSREAWRGWRSKQLKEWGGKKSKSGDILPPDQ